MIDLCVFFAHSEGRDKGESHRVVDNFLKAFIDANINNSGITIPTALFKKNDIIRKIIIHLSNNNVRVNVTSFINNSDKFIKFLLESLYNVDYIIKNPQVKRCYLKRDGTQVYFCFQLQNIPARAIVRRDGPGMTCISIFYTGDGELKPYEVILK